MARPVRVRFAPSPTGPLHIGGVRTALYNYLFARQQGGTMILRIEDTDQTRFVPGAEDYIRRSLAWCGIELDESPWHGGPHAPYRQSERKATYQALARQLVERGQAYYAFDTPAELETMRQQLLASKAEHTGYGSQTRLQMKNSLSLPATEVQARLAAGEPYSVRLLVPAEGEVVFDDLVRGQVRVQANTIDDKVLLKSDGMPTYHLANVVDDHLMEISHVIRGEEWLPSAPLHVLLYRAFGWEATRPQFAHLPLLLKPEGEGKLSKRDGDRLGFSVFPLAWDGGAPAPETDETGPDDEPTPQPTGRSSGFREDGYLPAALLNFLALLGWHPTTDQELLSLPEMIAQFDLSRIHKAGARFDIQKAKWFNQQYIKQLSNEELAQQLTPELASRNLSLPPAKVVAIGGLMKERITFVKDIVTDGAFFFEPPTEYDAQVVAKKWNADLTGYLAALQSALATVPQLDEATARELTHQVAEQRGLKPGSLMQGLRVALTGAPGGPDLMGIIAVLGQAEVEKRLGLALAMVPLP